MGAAERKMVFWDRGDLGCIVVKVTGVVFRGGGGRWWKGRGGGEEERAEVAREEEA
ncbi:hypothetical protein KI387_042558, partial [Taxus chinensis]